MHISLLQYSGEVEVLGQPRSRPGRYDLEETMTKSYSDYLSLFFTAHTPYVNLCP